MKRVNEDIDYICKSYNLIDYQYQEINQKKMAKTAKSKWLSKPEFIQQSSSPQNAKAV